MLLKNTWITQKSLAKYNMLLKYFVSWILEEREKRKPPDARNEERTKSQRYEKVLRLSGSLGELNYRGRGHFKFKIKKKDIQAAAGGEAGADKTKCHGPVAETAGNFHFLTAQETGNLRSGCVVRFWGGPFLSCKWWHLTACWRGLSSVHMNKHSSVFY